MARTALPSKVKKNIDEYINALKKDKIPIDKAYLFGSYAKGKQHKCSDIDLCIISSQFKDPWETLQYLWSKRLHNDGITIEPVGSSPESFQDWIPLVREIKRSGKQILEK